MNDRVDLAMASNADGVHLGQDELLDIADAQTDHGRRAVDRHFDAFDFSSQRSCARWVQITSASVRCFLHSTKAFDSHVGLELVSAVAKEIKLPAFAIGGISLSNVREICEAGQSRVAVQNAIVGADDPGHVAKEFIKHLVA